MTEIIGRTYYEVKGEVRNSAGDVFDDIVGHIVWFDFLSAWYFQPGVRMMREGALADVVKELTRLNGKKDTPDKPIIPIPSPPRKQGMAETPKDEESITPAHAAEPGVLIETRL